MTVEYPRCYACSAVAETEAGTIYVRRRIDGRFESVPICDACWRVEQPGRAPVRFIDPDRRPTGERPEDR